MVIGITGHARNGKDVIADILINDFHFEKRSFAKPLKDACKIIFDWTEEHVNGKLKEVEDQRWGITPRLAMQLIGTDFAQECLCKNSLSFARTTGRSLWVKRCLIDIEGKNIVIPDVRFLHEAQAIKDIGGKIIRVVRPGFEGTSNHASETEMAQIQEDERIINDQGLDVLKQRVYDAYMDIMDGLL